MIGPTARARSCLTAAVEKMKKNADVKWRELHFEVGDKVFLSFRNLALALAGTLKMKAKFVRPFEIVKRIGTVAFMLKMLKQCLGCIPASMSPF